MNISNKSDGKVVALLDVQGTICLIKAHTSAEQSQTGKKLKTIRRLYSNAYELSAYFLTRHPSFNPNHHSITILEATAIAAGASGKAGGLLALWAYPPSIVPLSFRLHAELAARHDGAKRWGYRAVQAGSIRAKAEPNRLETPNTDSGTGTPEWKKLPKQDGASLKSLQKKGIPDDLDWFIPDGLIEYSSIGDADATAQVHPYQFTTSMAELSQDRGAEVKVGAHVDSIDYTGGHIKSVTYTDRQSKQTHTILATDVIVSAGPWSSHVFPDMAVDALRAHSVTINANVTPYVLFTDIELPKDFGAQDEKKRKHGRRVNPEVYARPNGEVYVCGMYIATPVLISQRQRSTYERKSLITITS